MIELNIMRANTPLPGCEIEWAPVNSQFFKDYELNKAIDIAVLVNKMYTLHGINDLFKVRLLSVSEKDFTVSEMSYRRWRLNNGMV